ncbi:MAG: mechanosensitive ion channel family protein [Thermoanaerobaculia bacterium]|nr:mechanosensitive ion channel family protein [Thermoanaerobaculia bacterium]
MEWLNRTFWDNTIAQYLTALGIVVVALLILALFRFLLKPRLGDADETETRWDDLLRDLLSRTRLMLLALVLLFFSLKPLTLPEIATTLIRGIAIIAFLVQIGIWLSAALDFWLARYREGKIETDAAAVTTIAAIGFMAKIGIWVLLVLTALHNFGFNVTALVAGLGIGGVAIALALQNILGDLFASLSIVIDKPFVIGDFIIVGNEFMGTVENIGLRTTRIRSLGGEQLIISNGDLLQSRIRNYKRMEERRVVHSFGVTYDTPSEKIEKIPETVREIIESLDNSRFERSHFKGFGDSSLLFETIFWITQPDFALMMDIQQKLNLELMRRFEAEGISFAFPTRTIHFADGNPERMIKSTPG